MQCNAMLTPDITIPYHTIPDDTVPYHNNTPHTRVVSLVVTIKVQSVRYVCL